MGYLTDKTLESDLRVVRELIDEILDNGASREEVWNSLQAVYTFCLNDVSYIKQEMDRIGGPPDGQRAFDLTETPRSLDLARRFLGERTNTPVGNSRAQKEAALHRNRRRQF